MTQDLAQVLVAARQAVPVQFPHLIAPQRLVWDVLMEQSNLWKIHCSLDNQDLGDVRLASAHLLH